MQMICKGPMGMMKDRVSPPAEFSLTEALRVNCGKKFAHSSYSLLCLHNVFDGLFAEPIGPPLICRPHSFEHAS